MCLTSYQLRNWVVNGYVNHVSVTYTHLDPSPAFKVSVCVWDFSTSGARELHNELRITNVSPGKGTCRVCLLHQHLSRAFSFPHVSLVFSKEIATCSASRRGALPVPLHSTILCKTNRRQVQSVKPCFSMLSQPGLQGTSALREFGALSVEAMGWLPAGSPRALYPSLWGFAALDVSVSQTTVSITTSADLQTALVGEDYLSHALNNGLWCGCCS